MGPIMGECLGLFGLRHHLGRTLYQRVRSSSLRRLGEFIIWAGSRRVAIRGRTTLGQLWGQGAVPQETLVSYFNNLAERYSSPRPTKSILLGMLP